jgi:hypothetical protein
MSAKLTLKYYFTWRKYVMSLHLPPCAVVLLDYLEINQGENWLFHENNIKSDTGLTSKDTFYKAKKALLEAKLITWQGQNDGIRIRVTYDVQKSDVQKSDVQKSDVQKSDYIERKKRERKEENKIKEENTHKGSCVASDAPAGAAASVCVSPAPSSGSVSQKDSKAAKAAKAAKAEIPVSENPPSREDIAAYISKLISGRPEVSSWNEQDISGTAFDIWNHYTNTSWKTASGSPMLCWQNAVIGWLRRNRWLPEQSRQQTPAPVPSSGLLPAQKTSSAAEKQKSFKQMQQEWIERPLTDPDTFIVESAAHSIFNATCEDEVQGTLNSTPVHLRERALALAEQMRKEQGGRPRIINTPSTFTYENEDETS